LRDGSGGNPDGMLAAIDPTLPHVIRAGPAHGSVRRLALIVLLAELSPGAVPIAICGFNAACFFWSGVSMGAPS
jgi:hypothetical protein